MSPPPATKETGSKPSLERAQRLGRFKNAALVSAVIGFGLQLAGTVTGHTQLAQVGMGMFLFGLPLFFVALYLGRRWQPAAPVAPVEKGPARRPRRRKK
jgi:uncharacterized membrane protein YtjA (UPF0391 family)